MHLFSKQGRILSQRRREGAEAQGILGDTPGVSAGGEVGLASAGRDGPLKPRALVCSRALQQPHSARPALCDVPCLPNVEETAPLHGEEEPSPRGTGTLAVPKWGLASVQWSWTHFSQTAASTLENKG